ncbi:3-ketosteroid-delta-1-dehydrogenase [Amycolatopsis taiwanensis]|uniref:3-ketosteroid-delta-1-dehydrogenase n=1 Tax=Amycolatopsis taiwanensis TaxID=342230 RepID=A0A9W6R0T9_9PSEU|nr:3-ketosteroid-delta-1-dehydrogenase [Amycolatopsis taiwanensis]GLY65470.1 3-ketosteroid-delta-1-dehydrogenase [Amycolatopsis taiwanensis]
MSVTEPLAPAPARDTSVDLLVIGSGTGMAAALAAAERGLDVLIVEKTDYVGGSTARSGGAFWIPASPILAESGAADSPQRAVEYTRAAVGDTAPEERWQAFLDHGPQTVEMLRRTTPLKFFWAKGYSDYHPELPGGSAVGRTCESRPFDASVLGAQRRRLRPGLLKAPVPMPVTGADYKWMNLLTRAPLRALPRVLRRAAQGIGGLAVGREYLAGGQALAAGLYAGVLRAGIPVWTRTALTGLLTEGETVTGARLVQDGREVTVTARRGVVLAAGGFDHDLAMRRKYQLESIEAGWSLGSEGNTGDAIGLAQEIGADVACLDQAWWFPEVAPLPGRSPQVLLAERSLPGSFMVDGTGNRFVNEATDYMSFGQTVQARERAGDPVGTMWLVFDQAYRNRYVFAGSLFPRMPIPPAWFEAGIAHRAATPGELAEAVGVPVDAFTGTFARFNALAATGTDHDFHRGASAYDRYYGDPTVAPNPNLRPLAGTLYAVRVVLGDLGTCGGLRADRHGRVLRTDGTPMRGLYALGNTAANAFGHTYPGAGATIGQGLVFGTIVAEHAALGEA